MLRVTKVETGDGPEIDEILKRFLNYMRDEEIRKSGKTEEEYENDQFRRWVKAFLLGSSYTDENGDQVSIYKSRLK